MLAAVQQLVLRDIIAPVVAVPVLLVEMVLDLLQGSAVLEHPILLQVLPYITLAVVVVEPQMDILQGSVGSAAEAGRIHRGQQSQTQVVVDMAVTILTIQELLVLLVLL
jgi:hypothetical protein